jgi:hypothetical protein
MAAAALCRRAALAVVALVAVAATAALAQRGQAPPSSNPYANVNWSGCEFGYCPPVDLSIEQAFYAAAAKGDVTELQRLLREHGGGGAAKENQPATLNLTRNIVPDDSGHARVLDVAVWAAVRAGKPDAVRALFMAAPEAKQPDEEGHLVELAAENGDLAMLRLLLDDEQPATKPRFSKGGLDMPMGPSALALAALKGNVPAMQLLLERDTERVKREMKMGGRVTRPPLDLKAGMGAASRSGKVEAIRAMVDAGGMAAPHHPVTGRASIYDWQGEFVEEALGAAAFEARTQWRRALVPLSPPNADAVAAANAKALAAERSTAARGSLAASLRLLLEGGNYTVPWAKAQSLVAQAARAGDPEALQLLFAQPTIGDDSDELAEAAQRALGVAAEEGRAQVIRWVLTEHPQAARGKACGAALKRAVMYDHPDAIEALLMTGGSGGKERGESEAEGGVCGGAKATAAAAKQSSYQDAGWLGAVLSSVRRGANDALEALLAGKVAAVGEEKTAKLLGSYHTVRSAGDDEPEDGGAAAAGGGKGATPPAPQRQDRDPLAAAAARGDARAVRALLPLASGLCSTCAAVEAARGGHLDLLKLLTKGEGDGKSKGGKGVAVSVLEQESTGGATDGLRCLAQALDQGQWSVIEWLAGEHQKGKHLLAYFLPAIAQHVDVGNMERMVGVLERAIVEPREEGEGEEGGDGDGGDKSKKKKRRAPRLLSGLDPTEISYVRDQVHSASVSAALKGQPGMLATLQGSRLAKALFAEEQRQNRLRKKQEEQEALDREQERAFMEKKKREEEEEEAKKKDKQEL